MTPEERNLVIELFDRLATLEDAQRDPDAERLIRDGLRQAPNAPYALVQTVLVQDEALKRADARIRELEGEPAAERAARHQLSRRRARQSFRPREGRGSVPSVRPEDAHGACRRPGVPARPQPQAAGSAAHGSAGSARRRRWPVAAVRFWAPRPRQRPA